MDSSPFTSIRGVYVPPTSGGDNAKFRPLNRKDLESASRTKIVGTIVPKNSGYKILVSTNKENFGQNFF